MSRKTLGGLGRIEAGVRNHNSGRVVLNVEAWSRPFLVEGRTHYLIEEFEMPIGRVVIDGFEREVRMFCKAWAKIPVEDRRKMAQIAANERMIKRSPILW